jgi:ATP-dependent RNA helicase UAP56/SUB2
MSAQDAEDLIDYEDEHDVVSGGAGASTSAGGLAAGDDKGKNFSGIHSTGFR